MEAVARFGVFINLTAVGQQSRIVYPSAKQQKFGGSVMKKILLGARIRYLPLTGRVLYCSWSGFCHARCAFGA